MRTLTASAMATFAHCAQRYQYKYLLKIHPIAYFPAGTTGKGIHAGIEKFHCAGRKVTATDAIMAARLAMKEDLVRLRPLMDLDEFADVYEQAKRDRAKVCAMLRAYTETRPRLTMILSEGKLQPRPIVNPATGKRSRTFNVGGVFDGIYQLDDKRLMLYELKSTSDSLKEASVVLAQSIQPQLYLAMLPADMQVSGVCIDIVKKPVVPFKKAVSRTKNKPPREVIAEPLQDYEDRCYRGYLKQPERFFRRIILPVDPERIRNAMSMAWRIAQSIRDADKYGYMAYRGSHCKSAAGWCDYRNLCWYNDTENYVHREYAHEELELTI